jgi:rubrerythrin
MLDSESQLREAIQKMLEPKKTGEAAAAAPQDTNTMHGVTHKPMPDMSHEGMLAMSSTTNAEVKHICPMPEHVSIEYDRPGKCPICGMTLVPVTAATLQKLQPGGKLLYYTCPMPEHSDVRENNPGKCPKCGMTLIPVMEAPPLQKSAANQINPAKIETLPTLFTCPMASHADVVSAKPGKCPKCEMDLVPTSSVTHGRIAEANWRKQHPSVGQPTPEHEH